MLSLSYEPDVELRIELTDNTFKFEIHSSHEDLSFYRSRVGSITLQTHPNAYLVPIFERMNQMAADTNPSQANNFMQELKSIGYQLFNDLVPKELKQAYWRLYDFRNEVFEREQRVLSLLITSDEPWIPWEILTPFEEGTNRESDFLAATFLVSRWIAGAKTPKRHITIRRACMVAPELDLDFVIQEYEMFQTFAEQNVIVEPRITMRSDVLRIAQEEIHLLHLTTHGRFDEQYPTEASLCFEDNSLLLPRDLLGPNAKGLSNARPLVFLNACHTSRMEATAFSVTGWAHHMVIKVGVGSFVGTYWAIDDRLASLFSQTFYANLLRGQYLGEAFYNARHSVRQHSPANPTWLAYTLYGDPYCQVTWGDINQNTEVTTSLDSTSQLSAEFIAQLFEDETKQGLRRVQTYITGINTQIQRDEVSQIEEQLSQGKQVVALGESGVGKSGIASVLINNARSAGKAVLYLDCRRVILKTSDAELQQHFELTCSVRAAVKLLGAHQGCRLVVDQFDNTVHLQISQLLIDILTDCASFSGVEIVLISRAKETQEEKLLERFTMTTDGRFVKKLINELNSTQVTDTLANLGIEPTDDLIALGTNLLNLELIAKIKYTNPEYDWGNVKNEVILWEQYLKIVQDQETYDIEQASLKVALDFAYQSLRNNENQLLLDIQPTATERRLVSWGILVQIEGRVYQFRHEQLRDYLYAWNATQAGKMPENIIEELTTPYRARNVLLWMDKIYLYKRSRFSVEFARKMLNV